MLRTGSRLLSSLSTVTLAAKPTRPCACRQAQHILPLLALSATPASRRFFTPTLHLRKKKAAKEEKAKGRSGGKASNKSLKTPVPPATEGNEGELEGEGNHHPAPNPEEPQNFADVHSRWTAIHAHFEEVLKRFRPIGSNVGGKKGDGSGGGGGILSGAFRADILGALPVTTTRNGTFPLQELAEIVPRPGGRAVSLLAHDKSYVKPIMSAIQASADFNQQPQRDPDNDLELLLKVEAESPDDVAKHIKEACHTWRERLRQVRAKREKTIRAWAKEKVVLTDVARKLHDDLQKLQEKELAKVDKAEAKTLQDVKRRMS